MKTLYDLCVDARYMCYTAKTEEELKECQYIQNVLYREKIKQHEKQRERQSNEA